MAKRVGDITRILPTPKVQQQLQQQREQIVANPVRSLGSTFVFGSVSRNNRFAQLSRKLGHLSNGLRQTTAVLDQINTRKKAQDALKGAAAQQSGETFAQQKSRGRQEGFLRSAGTAKALEVSRDLQVLHDTGTFGDFTYNRDSQTWEDVASQFLQSRLQGLDDTDAPYLSRFVPIVEQKVANLVERDNRETIASLKEERFTNAHAAYGKFSEAAAAASADGTFSFDSFEALRKTTFDDLKASGMSGEEQNAILFQTLMESDNPEFIKAFGLQKRGDNTPALGDVKDYGFRLKNRLKNLTSAKAAELRSADALEDKKLRDVHKGNGDVVLQQFISAEGIPDKERVLREFRNRPDFIERFGREGLRVAAIMDANLSADKNRTEEGQLHSDDFLILDQKLSTIKGAGSMTEDDILRDPRFGQRVKDRLLARRRDTLKGGVNPESMVLGQTAAALGIAARSPAGIQVLTQLKIAFRIYRDDKGTAYNPTDPAVIAAFQKMSDNSLKLFGLPGLNTTPPPAATTPANRLKVLEAEAAAKGRPLNSADLVHSVIGKDAFAAIVNTVRSKGAEEYFKLSPSVRRDVAIHFKNQPTVRIKWLEYIGRSLDNKGILKYMDEVTFEGVDNIDRFVTAATKAADDIRSRAEDRSQLVDEIGTSFGLNQSIVRF